MNISLMVVHVGIAYTIDPAYESEVRDYLGRSLELSQSRTVSNDDMPRRLSREGA